MRYSYPRTKRFNVLTVNAERIGDEFFLPALLAAHVG